MDPLTIASLFALVGGAGANYMGGNEVDDERARIQEAERARQEKLNAEAARVNAQSRDRYKNIDNQQKDTAKSLGSYFVPPQAAPATPPQQSMPASASNITVSEEKNQTGKAKAYTDQQGQALGDLRSFGELFGGISRDQARGAGTIGQINDFKKGSSAVVPYELEQAGHAGDMWKLIADVSQGLGKVGMNAALGGGSLPGFSPKAPAATAPSVAPTLATTLTPPGADTLSLTAKPPIPFYNPNASPFQIAQSYR